MNKVDRRDFILGAFLLPALVHAKANLSLTCPVCGGELVSAGTMHDDETRPSINLELWNRSSHGAFWPFYSDDSQICSHCYTAYNENFDSWNRASELSASFYIPLCQAIDRFPLQDRIDGLRTVYHQIFKGKNADGGRTESVSYWARDSKPFRLSLQSYGDANRLKILFYTAPSKPGEVHVSAETSDDLLGLPVSPTTAAALPDDRR